MGYPGDEIVRILSHDTVNTSVLNGVFVSHGELNSESAGEGEIGYSYIYIIYIRLFL